jgi:hypothetical protein
MNDLEINSSLVRENIFELFRLQMKKDFEGAGINADFTNDLAKGIEALRLQLSEILKPVIRRPAVFASLLYRVDISEHQLTKHTADRSLSFEEQVVDLIIKRILQKVIIKKSYGNK